MTARALTVLGPTGLAWAQRAAQLPAGRPRLLLADIDGVITRGEGQPVDLHVLEALARQNRQALDDPEQPALTLCTGRQAPYVELMAQMTATFLPCIFEHGAGLFVPDGYRFVFADALGPDYSARLARLRAALDPLVLLPRRAFAQPGKEATMTLYPLPGTAPDELFDLVSKVADGWTVERNVEHVEVRPPGIDKGSGLRWLAELLRLPPTAIAGVGDSASDLHFLREVGFSAAPANAAQVVQEAVDYVSQKRYGDGLLDILERCLTVS